jgi:hypothetical protein
MSYNLGDLDFDSGGGFGPYEATVANAGVAQGKYGPQMVFVCKPTNHERRTQILFMGMGKDQFVFGGDSETIVIGEGEKAFETSIQKEIVSGPKIKVITKAGLFLNNLKHLGFELVGGDMTAFVGMVLDLEEIKFNDAIRRFNKTHPDSTLQELSGDYANAKITIPTKIIKRPAKKVSLQEAVMEVIEGKTEAEMEAWYKAREGFDGSVTPLYKMLTKLEETSVRVINNKYQLKGDKKSV